MEEDTTHSVSYPRVFQYKTLKKVIALLKLTSQKGRTQSRTSVHTILLCLFIRSTGEGRGGETQRRTPVPIVTSGNNCYVLLTFVVSTVSWSHPTSVSPTTGQIKLCSTQIKSLCPLLTKFYIVVRLWGIIFVFLKITWKEVFSDSRNIYDRVIKKLVGFSTDPFVLLKTKCTSLCFELFPIRRMGSSASL